MKMLADYNNIPTPNYVFAFELNDINKALPYLKYPLIVKPHNGFNSVGLTPQSVVNNE